MEDKYFHLVIYKTGMVLPDENYSFDLIKTRFNVIKTQLVREINSRVHIWAGIISCIIVLNRTYLYCYVKNERTCYVVKNNGTVIIVVRTWNKR